MPIYAYRCTHCGHAQDVLQKLSDPVLTRCPACGVDSFAKQVTAAGFQLKGSGWYVTDFRGGNTAPKGDGEAAAGEKSGEKPVEKAVEKPGDAAAGKPAPVAAQKAGGTAPAEKAASPASPAPAPPAGG